MPGDLNESDMRWIFHFVIVSVCLTLKISSSVRLLLKVRHDKETRRRKNRGSQNDTFLLVEYHLNGRDLR